MCIDELCSFLTYFSSSSISIKSLADFFSLSFSESSRLSGEWNKRELSVNSLIKDVKKS